MHKVLIITNDLEIGGIQKSLIDFLEYLVNQNLEIDLLVWQKDGILKNKIPKTVNIIEVKYAKTSKNITQEKNIKKKIQYFLNYLQFNFFSRIIKKPWLYFPKIEQHYDEVVSYSQNGYPRFYAIDRVSANKKYLWFHHGSYNLTNAEYILDKKYYPKFDKIVTVSLSNKKMLAKYFPEHKDKIKVVPNIINIKEIIKNSNVEVSDFPKMNGKYNFVTVSRFSKEKGIDLAIEIAAELKTEGLQFKWYFIGSGDTFLEIKKMINQRSLQDVCILLGEKENPYPYMKLADLYVQTSYVESQSITIYEALVLKKLIVTINLPALNEALQNGKLGVLCKPEKMDFVAEIKNILNDSAAKTRLNESVKKNLVSNESAYDAINQLFI